LLKTFVTRSNAKILRRSPSRSTKIPKTAEKFGERYIIAGNTPPALT